jgi:hypothetical protein
VIVINNVYTRIVKWYYIEKFSMQYTRPPPWQIATGLGCLAVMLVLSNLERQTYAVTSLATINVDVHVATCSTKGVKHFFDFTVNVCKDAKKWGGFGWKMKQFRRYIDAQDNNTLVVLVDGADSFVNRLAFKHSLLQKWNALQADVVVASEEACSAVQDCTAEMVQTLYPRLAHTKAPFVNSPIAGRAWALKEVFAKLIQYSGAVNSFDDQLAMTQLVGARVPGIPKTIRIVHDTGQTVFGSFVHLRKYVEGQRIYKKTKYGGLGKLPKYTCVDDNKLLVFGCIDVGIQRRTDHEVQLLDGTLYSVDEDCDVVRLNSMLGFDPVFWHGNGPGRHVFKYIQKKREHCFQKLTLRV